MKANKLQELRSVTSTELVESLNGLKKELFNLTFKS